MEGFLHAGRKKEVKGNQGSVYLEPQRLRTPSQDAVTDATSSGNGLFFLMTSTGTQPIGVGTDLCMVTGETTAGKTVVPSTQSRLVHA